VFLRFRPATACQKNRSYLSASSGNPKAVSLSQQDSIIGRPPHR
jgi:hypothetical protein